MEGQALFIPPHSSTSGLGGGAAGGDYSFLNGFEGWQAGAPAAAEQQDQQQVLMMEEGRSARPRGGRRPLRKAAIELEELQSELQKKHQEFQAATAEQERLRQRLKLLEVVLPVREQQLQMLERQTREQATHVQAGPPRLPQYPHHPPPRITELHSSDSSDCSSLMTGLSPPQQQELPLLARDEQTAAAGARAGADVEQAAGPGHATAGCSGMFMVPTMFPPPGGRGHDKGGAVMRRFIASWNTWVRDAGLLLHAHDARPHDPGPSLKLARLRGQLIPMMRALRQEHPGLLLDVVGINVETGERDSPPPDHWIAVAHGLSLSAEQTADCLAALALFREKMGPTLAERQGLMLQLASAMEELQGQGGARGQALAAKCSDLTLRVEEVTDKLHRNVAAEGQSVEIVKDFLGNGVMTVVQSVRTCVLAYPFFPDALSILNTIADNAGSRAQSVSGSGGSQALAIAMRS